MSVGRTPSAFSALTSAARARAVGFWPLISLRLGSGHALFWSLQRNLRLEWPNSTDNCINQLTGCRVRIGKRLRSTSAPLAFTRSSTDRDGQESQGLLSQRDEVGRIPRPFRRFRHAVPP